MNLMPRRRIGGVLCALGVVLALAGCGTEEQVGEPPSDSATEANGAQSSDQPVLFDGGAAAFGNVILVAGGHYQAGPVNSEQRDESKPLDIRASNLVAEYALDGRLTGTRPLPVPDGHYLFLPTIQALGEVRYVAGGVCPLPRFEAGFCGAASAPVLYRIAGDKVDAVDAAALTPTPAGGGQLPPGAGRLIGVGASGSAVYMVQPTGAGPYPQSSTVRLVRYDEENGFKLVDLPDGVLTAGSVCASPAGVLSVVPQLDSRLQIVSIDILGFSDGAVGNWQPLGTVKIDPPIASTYGGIVCSGSAGLFWLEDAGSTAVWSFEFDSARPSLDVEPPARIPGSGWARADNRRIVLTANEASGSGSYWEFSTTRAENGRKLSERRADVGQIGAPALGVALDDGVFDISDLLLTVPEASSNESSAPRRVSD